MDKFLKWTGLGALIGWAVISMKTTAVMAVAILLKTGGFPSDLYGHIVIGAVLGGLYGLYAAGVRIRLE